MKKLLILTLPILLLAGCGRSEKHDDQTAGNDTTFTSGDAAMNADTSTSGGAMSDTTGSLGSGASAGSTMGTGTTAEGQDHGGGNGH